MELNRKVMQLEIEETALKKEEDNLEQRASGESSERAGRTAQRVPDQRKTQWTMRRKLLSVYRNYVRNWKA